jgi:hypothetical protein
VRGGELSWRTMALNLPEQFFTRKKGVNDNPPEMKNF